MDVRTSKILNSILFFANKSNGTIERLKLMKLLWLSDRIHLNKYGRLILKDNYNAMPHGPVPSTAMNYSNHSVADNYKVSGYRIKAEKEFNEDYFSKSDLEVMNLVWEKFGGMTPFRLRDLSHYFPEWIRFKSELENDFLPNSYPMVLEDFFVHPNLEQFKDIFSIEDSQDSLTYFHSHNAIQSNLNEQCH
ncbi:SocA family protein [Flavobacterium sp. LaA7.5]|nr:SocA family protein [Flavobacterium salilacus subsp. altitudinum]